MCISVFINNILFNRNMAVKQQDLAIAKKAKTRIISSQKGKYTFILDI